MATLRERVLNVIRSTPGLTDREITNHLLGSSSPQQGVNQAARRLASERLVRRRPRADGRLGNYPAEVVQESQPSGKGSHEASPVDSLSEDEVKRKLRAWLEADAWKASVVWGRGQGIDTDARRGERRWLIEVKGRGSLNPMRVNYFLGVLGEILQRMNDPGAKYSIALPDLPQFRRLWARLPALAKQRTRMSALFVADSGQVEEVV